MTTSLCPRIERLTVRRPNGSDNQTDPADSLPEMQETLHVTKPGDLWLLHRHRVLCGNALDETSFCLLMQNRKAAMVFVDPPYNVPIVGHATGLGVVRHRDFAMARGEMSTSEYTDFLAQGFELLSRYKRPRLNSLCL